MRQAETPESVREARYARSSLSKRCQRKREQPRIWIPCSKAILQPSVERPGQIHIPDTGGRLGSPNRQDSGLSVPAVIRQSQGFPDSYPGAGQKSEQQAVLVRHHGCLQFIVRNDGRVLSDRLESGPGSLWL